MLVGEIPAILKNMINSKALESLYSNSQLLGALGS